MTIGKKVQKGADYSKLKDAFCGYLELTDAM